MSLVASAEPTARPKPDDRQPACELAFVRRRLVATRRCEGNDRQHPEPAQHRVIRRIMSVPEEVGLEDPGGRRAEPRR